MNASPLGGSGAGGITVIGLGYWGPNVLRVLGDHDSVEVPWICDLDTERLAGVE